MGIKNIKSLLVEGTQLPAAIEAKLPAGAPKLSTMLVDATNKIPAMPDFPIEIPNLPAMPVLPAMPGSPAALRQYVTAAQVITTPTLTPTPAKRGLVNFVYE